MAENIQNPSQAGELIQFPRAGRNPTGGLATGVEVELAAIIEVWIVAPIDRPNRLSSFLAPFWGRARRDRDRNPRTGRNTGLATTARVRNYSGSNRG